MQNIIIIRKTLILLIANLYGNDRVTSSSTGKVVIYLKVVIALSAIDQRLIIY